MKYAPGLMVGQLSGSVGSTTASRNRFGSYFRSRVMGTNPNTVAQQAARALFGGFSAAWRSLTESQRTGWDDLALSNPQTDRLGSQYFNSGAQLYVGLNTSREAVGAAPLDVAPSLDAPPVPLTATLTADDTPTLSVAYTATDGTAVNFFIIRATPTVSAGRAFFRRSDFRQIQVVAGNVASPISIAAAYEAVFGDTWETQLGMQIAVELVPVSQNGFQGTPLRAVAVIATV